MNKRNSGMWGSQKLGFLNEIAQVGITAPLLATLCPWSLYLISPLGFYLSVSASFCTRGR